MRVVTNLLLLATVVALVDPVRAQTVLPATLLVAEGDSVDVPGGQRGLITNVNDPMTNGQGQAGFTGSISIGGVTKSYVWHNDGVIWHSDMGLPTVLSGAEAYMGIGDGGTFIYSPSIDASSGGGDGVWTDQGELLHDNDPAPGIPGMFITFCSRSNMLPNGTAHWMSGITDTAGGTTQAEVIYRSTDRTPASTTVLFQEGGMIGGFATDDLALDYDVSENMAHFAMQPFLNTGLTTNDAVVTLDSVIIAQEGSPTGGGDNWANFNLVRVNNSGTLVFTGDTSGPTTSDGFIAVDGTIVIREGQTVGGVTLGSTDRGIALRNDGIAAWAWTTSVGTADEALFVGQASDLAASSLLVLRTGDGLDTTGDMVADYTVADFESLASDGQGSFDWTGGTTLFTMLELTPAAGGDNIVANVGLDMSAFLPTAGAPAPAPGAASLAVTPNPVRDAATVTLALEAAGTVTVEVLDVLGRRVALVHEGDLTSGRSTLSVDTSLLEAGVYVVRATGTDWTLSQRVTRF